MKQAGPANFLKTLTVFEFSAELELALALLLVVAGVKAVKFPGRSPYVMENYSLVERVRSEFLEMPGLCLTPAQAARLWGMDEAACQRVISALVRSAFLRWTPGGMVVRSEQ